MARVGAEAEVGGGGVVIGRSVAGPRPSGCGCSGCGCSGCGCSGCGCSSCGCSGCDLGGVNNGSSVLDGCGGGVDVGDGAVVCCSSSSSAPAVVSCCESCCASSAAAEALRSLISTGVDDGRVSCVFGFRAEDIAGVSATEEVAIGGVFCG